MENNHRALPSRISKPARYLIAENLLHLTKKKAPFHHDNAQGHTPAPYTVSKLEKVTDRAEVLVELVSHHRYEDLLIYRKRIFQMG